MMKEKSYKIPEISSRRFRFIRFPEINAETGEETYTELPVVDGVLKCPVSQAKRFCSCSPRHIKNMMDEGKLTRYNADLSIRK
ncbi:MAG TPA: hypothetical protein DEG32_10860, partial [Balneolaceae bacterium]|nr:hypothetical protein [Balneolaceae bacterium]